MCEAVVRLQRGTHTHFVVSHKRGLFTRASIKDADSHVSDLSGKKSHGNLSTCKSLFSQDCTFIFTDSWKGKSVHTRKNKAEK